MTLRRHLSIPTTGCGSGPGVASRASSRPQAPRRRRQTLLIADVRIRGVPQAIPELGTPALTGLTLEPDQNQIEIGYTVLSLGPGGGPKYQYRLEGADAGWSQPSDDRRVTYVTLAPGDYRFLVRAVTADGTVTDPATIAFVILPASLAASLVRRAQPGAAGSGRSLVHRARVSRLVAVERMRTGLPPTCTTTSARACHRSRSLPRSCGSVIRARPSFTIHSAASPTPRAS